MRNSDSSPAVVDALGSDPQALQERAGASGKLLMAALDHAVKMQSSSITGYVNWLRKRNPEATPAEIQRMLDKHFTYLATGSGASAGMAAAVPGIGFVTGAAAVGAESLVFLDAAAFYTMASAYLRGADISDGEHRKALILVVMLGSAGTAIVDAAVGDLNKQNGASTLASLSRFGAPKVAEINNKLLRRALKEAQKRFGRAWIGKIMPLGIGAVVGTVANRKLAQRTLSKTRESLGPVPAEFPAALPALEEISDEARPEADAAVIATIEKTHSEDGAIKRGVGTIGSAAGHAAHRVGRAVRSLPFIPSGKKDTED